MTFNFEEIKEKLLHFALILSEYAGFNYKTWEYIKRIYKTWGFKKQRQFEFIQDFSTWLNDGCSPAKACLSIIESGKSIRRLEQEVKAATAIYDALMRGDSISEGMVEWFDPDVVILFEAGQKAGSKALTHVVNEYLKQELEIKQAKRLFWGPIKQPLLYLLMCIGFMIVMGLFVLPQFSSIMPPEKMSLSVRFVLSFSSLATDYYPFFILFCFFVYIGVRNFLHNNASGFRLTMDEYFPLNIYRNFAAMKTLKTLGILVETRYNLHKASVELKRHSNNYMKHHLNFIICQTQFGESDLGEALNSGLLNQRLMFRLKNAADSPDQNRKKSAISIASDRSGEEAVRTLTSTRTFMAVFFWIVMCLTLLMVVSSFMGVISSLFNMSYR